MRWASHIASAIKKAVDILDAEETQAIEVGGETFIPLETIPTPFVGLTAGAGASPAQAPQSFIGSSVVVKGASLPLTSDSLYQLSKGLWKVTLTWNYSGNFQTFGSGNGFEITLQFTNFPGNITNFNIVEAGLGAAAGGQLGDTFSFKLLCDADYKWAINARLGATGVGNQHEYSLGVFAEKYL
jgi:hypothetical protein